MKQRHFFLLISILIMFSCGEDNNPSSSASVESIHAFVDGGEKRILEEGADLLIGQTSPITGIPSSYFIGFEMLISDGRPLKGTVMPTSDGFLYVIAPKGLLLGWTTFSTSKTLTCVVGGESIELSLYMTRGYANRPMEIPSLGMTPEIIVPLAREIIIE